MKERVHEQLSNELQQASRSDTTITVIAIIVTFILFGIAFGFASNAVDYIYGPFNTVMQVSVPATAAVFISLIAMAVIDLFSIFALRNNARRKARLTEKLAGLYQDEGAPPYSADDIAMGYKSRGNLFAVIIGTLSGFGIVIPLIVFINTLVKEL